jgi:hypothetical protein
MLNGNHTREQVQALEVWVMARENGETRFTLRSTNGPAIRRRAENWLASAFYKKNPFALNRAMKAGTGPRMVDLTDDSTLFTVVMPTFKQALAFTNEFAQGPIVTHKVDGQHANPFDAMVIREAFGEGVFYKWHTSNFFDASEIEDVIEGHFNRWYPDATSRALTREAVVAVQMETYWFYAVNLYNDGHIAEFDEALEDIYRIKYADEMQPRPKWCFVHATAMTPPKALARNRF